MTARFEAFAATPLGKTIGNTIDTDVRYIEFRAFSREGFPAVTALVSDLKPILEPLRATDPALFDSAKQFVGWKVGGVMRARGHQIARKAARVPGKLFTVAAVGGPPLPEARHPVAQPFSRIAPR